MSDEPIRQHKRMAMGEDISSQTQGDKTHERYAGGGHVKGAHKHMHEHADMHGHTSVNRLHPKGHHGGHTHNDLHDHHHHSPGHGTGHSENSTGGIGTPGHKRSAY